MVKGMKEKCEQREENEEIVLVHAQLASPSSPSWGRFACLDSLEADRSFASMLGGVGHVNQFLNFDRGRQPSWKGSEKKKNLRF